MSQLVTLIWLKWTLFRNTMRSRKAALNQIASILGTLIVLAFALLLALGLGIAAYAFGQREGDFACGRVVKDVRALPGAPSEASRSLPESASWHRRADEPEAPLARVRKRSS